MGHMKRLCFLLLCVSLSLTPSCAYQRGTHPPFQTFSQDDTQSSPDNDATSSLWHTTSHTLRSVPYRFISSLFSGHLDLSDTEEQVSDNPALNLLYNGGKDVVLALTDTITRIRDMATALPHVLRSTANTFPLSSTSSSSRTSISDEFANDGNSPANGEKSYLSQSASHRLSEALQNLQHTTPSTFTYASIQAFRSTTALDTSTSTSSSSSSSPLSSLLGIASAPSLPPEPALALRTGDVRAQTKKNLERGEKTHPQPSRSATTNTLDTDDDLDIGPDLHFADITVEERLKKTDVSSAAEVAVALNAILRYQAHTVQKSLRSAWRSASRRAWRDRHVDAMNTDADIGANDVNTRSNPIDARDSEANDDNVLHQRPEIVLLDSPQTTNNKYLKKGMSNRKKRSAYGGRLPSTEPLPVFTALVRVPLDIPVTDAIELASMSTTTTAHGTALLESASKSETQKNGEIPDADVAHDRIRLGSVDAVNVLRRYMHNHKHAYTRTKTSTHTSSSSSSATLSTSASGSDYDSMVCITDNDNDCLTLKTLLTAAYIQIPSSATQSAMASSDVILWLSIPISVPLHSVEMVTKMLHGDITQQNTISALLQDQQDFFALANERKNVLSVAPAVDDMLLSLRASISVESTSRKYMRTYRDALRDGYQSAPSSSLRSIFATLADVELDCGTGKAVNASRIMYSLFGKEITLEEYAQITTLPSGIPNYSEDVNSQTGNTTIGPDFSSQVQYFASETWGKEEYWEKVFFPEERVLIQQKKIELEEAASEADDNDEDSDVLFDPNALMYYTVQLLLNRTNINDTYTVTDTNYNSGTGSTAFPDATAVFSGTGTYGNDATWAQRWLTWYNSTNAMITTLFREVCVCPYDVYGVLCDIRRPFACYTHPTTATLRFEKEGVVEEVDVPFDGVRGCAYKDTVGQGAQWERFDNRYDPTLIGAPPCLALPSTYTSSSVPISPLSLHVTATCTFIPSSALGIPRQGILPAYISGLGLQGYEWDTNYNFTYPVYRPASIDPKDGYANRDSPTASPPLLAFSTVSATPSHMASASALSSLSFDDKMFILTIYPQSHTRPTILSTVSYAHIPLATIIQPGNYSLVVDTPPLSALHADVKAGGRVHWVATIMQGQAGNYAQQYIRWTTEDPSYVPGAPRSKPLDTYIVWLIGGICVVVAIVAIIVGKVCYDRAQQRKLEKEGKATTLNDDIVRAR